MTQPAGPASAAPHLGWGGVLRLGLVQTALGAVVVLTTSTLNRVMVVELALPAMLPGLLVALHYAVQITRPRMGHGSDTGGRRTPWILGGMALLSLGGVLAAVATTWMQERFMAGAALATLAFVLIGLGVSASGTSLLALLAKRVAPQRRGPAATIVWLMMIFGFAMTAGIAGTLLDPYTPERLVAVSTGVSVLAMAVAVLALWRVEPPAWPAHGDGAAQLNADKLSLPLAPSPGFRAALAGVWAEPAAKRFTFFVFLSMLAYSSQDLILEPFAGLVFAWTPGESTALSGVQHAGVLVGMLVVAACTGWGRGWLRNLAFWSVGGCLLSAVALALLALAGVFGPPWPLRETVALMGAANGLFSIAAIASMMRLASYGRVQREGTRVGLWGAAQAMAFGIGGLAGAAASDLARWLVADVGLAYALVFAVESMLFMGAAMLAWQVSRLAPASPQELACAAARPLPCESRPQGDSPPSPSHGIGAAPPRLAN
ncbi:MAG: BCD family MFS transporter [Betaproteobacteria bacterium]|nr:BCD family MFS transporter [Betaproteobacteria bacterium]